MNTRARLGMYIGLYIGMLLLVALTSVPARDPCPLGQPEMSTGAHVAVRSLTLGARCTVLSLLVDDDIHVRKGPSISMVHT